MSSLADASSPAWGLHHQRTRVQHHDDMDGRRIGRAPVDVCPYQSVKEDENGQWINLPRLRRRTGRHGLLLHSFDLLLDLCSAPAWLPTPAPCRQRTVSLRMARGQGSPPAWCRRRGRRRQWLARSSPAWCRLAGPTRKTKVQADVIPLLTMMDAEGMSTSPATPSAGFHLIMDGELDDGRRSLDSGARLERRWTSAPASARHSEQDVRGVVCISDGDGLGALLAPGSFGRPLLPLPPRRKALGVEMCWLFIGTDRAGVEALPCTQSRRFDLLVYTRAARKLLELGGISARSR